MEAEFKALLTMEVTITPTTANAYGGAVPGTPATWPARVRFKRQEVATQAGEAVLAEGFLWLDVDVPVPGTRDKLLLPGGRPATVIAVDVVHDEVGPHHLKVWFGAPANG